MRQLAAAVDGYQPVPQGVELDHLLRAAGAFPQPLLRYQREVSNSDGIGAVLLAGTPGGSPAR
ncbi:MAG: hypothetical protein R2844_05385 [Caldilineales bacterium]